MNSLSNEQTSLSGWESNASNGLNNTKLECLLQLKTNLGKNSAAYLKSILKNFISEEIMGRIHDYKTSNNDNDATFLVSESDKNAIFYSLNKIIAQRGKPSFILEEIKEKNEIKLQNQNKVIEGWESHEEMKSPKSNGITNSWNSIHNPSKIENGKSRKRSRSKEFSYELNNSKMNEIQNNTNSWN